MVDDKYTHLLQPIRDLAANWNINIANELAEYLVSITHNSAPGPFSLVHASQLQVVGNFHPAGSLGKPHVFIQGR